MGIDPIGLIHKTVPMVHLTLDGGLKPTVSPVLDVLFFYSMVVGYHPPNLSSFAYGKKGF